MQYPTCRKCHPLGLVPIKSSDKIIDFKACEYCSKKVSVFKNKEKEKSRFYKSYKTAAQQDSDEFFYDMKDWEWLTGRGDVFTKRNE